MRPNLSVGLGSRAIAGASGRHSPANGSENPGHESLHSHQNLPMAGDDHLSLSPRDGAQHLTHGLFGIHHQPSRYGVFGSAMEVALVVHPPDVAVDEARADQGHLDSGVLQFRSDGVRQGPYCKLAHSVRGASRRRGPSGNAADDRDVAAGSLDFGERRIDGTQHAKNIGLELAAVIFQGKSIESATDPKTGIGDYNVKLAPMLNARRHGALQVAIARDVALHHHRLLSALSHNLLRQGLQQVPASRRESQPGPLDTKLSSQLLPNPRRSSGNEYHFVAKI